MKDDQYAARAEENNRQRFWKDITLVALQAGAKSMQPKDAAILSATVADHLLEEFDKRFRHGSNGRG